MERLRPGMIIVLFIFIAAWGCNDDMERVAVPPHAPMENVARIAVVGFENYTSDPSLTRHLEQIITSILRESEAYEIVDPISSRAALARLHTGLHEVAHPDVAMDLAQFLNVDALIIGSANYYFEDTRVSTPRCPYCTREDRPNIWSVTQSTSVIVTIEAKVIHAKDGREIWVDTAEGRDTTNRTIDLHWNQSNPPPASLLPRPNRSDIPQTRETALRQAARRFTADLLPRYTWVRKEEP